MAYWLWLWRIMKLKAILFDLDGTLVDSALSIGNVLNQMRIERNLCYLEIQKYREWISLGANDLIANSLEIPVSDVDPSLQDFRIRYASNKTASTDMFPYVKETLSQIKSLGIAMGFCSNKPINLCQKVLSDLNLDNYFSCVVGGGSTASSKPSREPIDLALSMIGQFHRDALLVGDSAVDQMASKNSGLPFIFFSGGYNDGVDTSQVTATIKSMNHLIPLAKREGWI
jgi:phosphoglycolate phosphatase